MKLTALALFIIVPPIAEDATGWCKRPLTFLLSWSLAMVGAIVVSALFARFVTRKRR
jgi:hypothetical protein